MTREIRRQAGMTQPEFAREIGVCESTVKKWEGKGDYRRVPSLESVKFIERFCLEHGIKFERDKFTLFATRKGE